MQPSSSPCRIYSPILPEIRVYEYVYEYGFFNRDHLLFFQPPFPWQKRLNGIGEKALAVGNILSNSVLLHLLVHTNLLHPRPTYLGVK